jgi:Kdo2-lipid IVA lauroyltransferase/acyltransferase
MGSRRQVLSKAGLVAFAFGQRAFLTRDVASAERRGERLGALWFRFDKKHRNRALANLELAFPEWTPEKRLEVAEGVFRHFGIVAADFLRSPKRPATEVESNMEVVGFEHVATAEAFDKGIIAVTGHFGNWERLAHWVSTQGRTISVIARDADDTGLNQKILEIRSVAGVEVLSRGNSAMAIMRRLRQKGVVGILNDQNTDETFVPFFGHPCGTVLGPAVMHRRTGAPILPCYCMRTGVGKYRLEIHPVLNTEGLSEDEITAKLNLILEETIRRYPEQWLWMHDRWKSARRAGLL